MGVLNGLELWGRGGELGPGGQGHHLVIPLAQADHLARPAQKVRRPDDLLLREHVVGVIERVLDSGEHLAHDGGGGVPLRDLAPRFAESRPGGQRRPGQLQLEVVESRQL